MKKLLLNLIVFIFPTIVTAHGWQEKIAAESIPKTVIVSIYGVKSVEIFGINFGTFPVSGRCSGVYIDEESSVLTANHCFNSENLIISSITVTNVYGNISLAEIVLDGGDIDLAILKPLVKYEGYKSPYAKLSSKLKLKPGQEVLTVGHPLGLVWTVTTGIISHTTRLIGWQYFVQFDAVIAPGSSGGPVFDTTGKLVGIMTAYRGGPVGSLTGLNFMASPSDISLILESFREIMKTTVIPTIRKYRIGDIK